LNPSHVIRRRGSKNRSVGGGVARSRSSLYIVVGGVLLCMYVLLLLLLLCMRCTVMHCTGGNRGLQMNGRTTFQNIIRTTTTIDLDFNNCRVMIVTWNWQPICSHHNMISINAVHFNVQLGVPINRLFWKGGGGFSIFDYPHISIAVNIQHS